MLVAAAVLLLVDLVQVGLRAPGSLGVTGVVWLAALYLVAAAAGTLVVRGLLRQSPATTRAVLVVVGLTLFAVESVLRALPPQSPWRSLAVAACGAAGLVAFAPLRGRLGARVGVAAAVLASVAGVLATGGVGGGRDTAPPAIDAAALRGRPSFLVVLVDTLRADHLSGYGYPRPTSPTLDRLASEGVRFERAIAQSSWTKPSTASLFTGRFPSEHQALAEASRLPDAETTIPEALRARGYATAVFSANPWVTPEYGFDQGVTDFFSVYDERFARVTLFMQVLKRVSQAAGNRMRLYNRVKYLVLGELSTTARDTRLVDEAIAWLGAPRDRPFFVYLHMMSPHHPYDPPPPFDRFVPDRTHRPVKNYPRKSYDFTERGDPLPAADLADMVARYDGDVLYADTEVGRLLAALERLGLAATTAVVVTADHGEEFYDHDNWGHGQSLYQELIRVPLIVRLPGGATPGTRDEATASLVDLLPTVLELAGAPPVAGARGRSLVPRLRGDAAGAAPAFSELVYQYETARALVDADRKLVVLQKGERPVTKLFDLGADPRERHPLPATTPDGVRLGRLLDEAVTAAAADRSPPSDATLDDDARARLRALGYAR